MEAIILAGGFGTRLRSVVQNIPKPMAPVAGRPFLEILLERIASQGAQHIVFSLGYLAPLIIRHFGGSYNGIEIQYVVEGAPLGTGGAIRLAMDVCKTDPVFVFNGDTYVEPDMNEVLSTWRGNPLVIAQHVEDTYRYGRIETEGSRLLAFNEKGVKGQGLINAGCYLLPRHGLNAFPPGQPFSIESDYLIPAVKHGLVDVISIDGVFIDIGTPEDFERAQTLLAGR
jgi:D-glycero-alpha-D-manno-heptose 1-phosphate guanylyltransferase